MKIPKGIVLIFVGLILVFAFVGWKSCRIAGQLAKDEAALADAKKAAAADHEVQLNIIAIKTKEIGQLTNQISQIMANANKPSSAEQAKDKQLADLRKSWQTLSAEGQAKLQELDKAWSDKFDLTVKRYEGAIFTLNDTWQKKFDAQVVISNAWQKQYSDEVALVALSDKAMTAANMKIKTLQLSGKLKYGLFIIGIIAGHYLWK